MEKLLPVRPELDALIDRADDTGDYTFSASSGLQGGHSSSFVAIWDDVTNMGDFMYRFGIAIVALCFQLPSSAATAPEFSACAKITDNLKRLSCYDALSAPQQVAVPNDGSRGAWQVDKDVSPLDDSQTVTLHLTADSDIHGWPSTNFRPVIIIRCKEKKTDAYIVTGMSPTVEYGRFNEASITLRLDKSPAYSVVASESTDNKALFLPSPAGSLKKWFGHQQLLFQFTPFNSGTVMTTFNIAGMETAIKPLRTACSW